MIRLRLYLLTETTVTRIGEIRVGVGALGAVRVDLMVAVHVQDQVPLNQVALDRLPLGLDPSQRTLLSTNTPSRLLSTSQKSNLPS